MSAGKVATWDGASRKLFAVGIMRDYGIKQEASQEEVSPADSP
ncbi:MAG TPA: hypothetical protein V6C93_07430 [Allocoleopsis sp.]